MAKTGLKLWQWQLSSFNTGFAVNLQSPHHFWLHTPPSCTENDICGFQFCWTVVTNCRFLQRGMIFYQKQPLCCSIDNVKWDDVWHHNSCTRLRVEKDFGFAFQGHSFKCCRKWNFCWLAWSLGQQNPLGIVVTIMFPAWKCQVGTAGDFFLFM